MCQGVVYVEVPYYQEGDIQGWKQGFRGDRMDVVVVCVCAVGVDQPGGVKIRPEERFLGGDIEGEDVIHLFEPWGHRKGSKERHMNIGHNTRLSDRGEQRLKAVEGRKLSLVNRGVLEEN